MIQLSIECDGDNCTETEYCDIAQNVIDIRQFRDYLSDSFGWTFDNGQHLCKACTEVKENANA